MTAAVLAALLLVPASALAAGRFYHADVQEGGDVEFRASFHNGSPKRVYKFQWANVPIYCDGGGQSATSWSDSGFEMKVGNDRKFNGTFDFGAATATAKGKFGDNTHKVTGTIRVQGTVVGGCTGDTGIDHWAHLP